MGRNSPQKLRPLRDFLIAASCILLLAQGALQILVGHAKMDFGAGALGFGFLAGLGSIMVLVGIALNVRAVAWVGASIMMLQALAWSWIAWWLLLPAWLLFLPLLALEAMSPRMPRQPPAWKAGWQQAP